MVKYLAVCSSETELGHLLGAIEKIGAKKDCIVLSLGGLEAGKKESGVVVKEYWDYISKQDLRRANNGAIDLAQGWYGLDKHFEKALEFEGISLGLVSVSSIRVVFRDAIRHLVALSNAVQKEGPDVVIAPKQGHSGRIVRAAAKKAGIKRIEFLDIGPEPGLNKWPNVSTAKFFEICKKTGQVFSGLVENRGNGELVFVRSRGSYLPGIENALKKTGFRFIRLTFSC